MISAFNSGIGFDYEEAMTKREDVPYVASDKYLTCGSHRYATFAT